MIWTEKYRPTTLDEVVAHPSTVRSLKSWVNTPADTPNVMFHGLPGNGKTSMVHSFARDLFGDYFHNNFVEFNASNIRKIEDVRERINKEARYGAKGGHPFRIIYLSELDGMTQAAMGAFKRVMEEKAGNVRWFADCNNIEKVDPAVRSRFVPFQIKRVPIPLVIERLDEIAWKESLTIGRTSIDTIAEYVRGDLRNAILILEALPRDDEEITPEFLRDLCPTPQRKNIVELLKINFSGSWDEREPILQEVIADDPSCIRSVEMIYDAIERNGLAPEKKWPYLKAISDYEIRITQGNPIHQLRCMLEEMKALSRVKDDR